MKYTENNITVYPLDMKKLSEDINTTIHNTYKDPDRVNKIYHVISSLGIILEPKPAIIDKDCAGSDLNNNKFTISVHAKEIKDGHETFDMLPAFDANFTIEDLKPYFTEPKTLKDFMGERYEYNPRISGNLYRWLKHFNEK